MAKNSGISATAKQIQKIQSRSFRTVMFFCGLLFVAFLLLGWCLIQDIDYLGYFDFSELLHSLTRRVTVENFMARAPLIINYTVSAAGRLPLTVNATPFLVILLICLIILSVFEGIALAIAEAASMKITNNKLKPLYRLAEAAQKLDREDYAVTEKKALKTEDKTSTDKSGSFETKRIESLENAIDNLKPERPDAEIHTGDKDLAGLEDSINSLLTRTRDSYAEQIRFVSDASHELRTPIAVIKGYTDMLDRWGKEDEKVLEESIAAIKSETDHMNKLVEQLLFLARGDSGRTKLTVERFSLTALIREVYDESVMIDESHSWRLVADEEVAAYGDTAMLKQATRILVDNAAKYTGDGETITLKAERDKNGAPLIVVQDNGIGIKNSDIPHVFERFYRSDESRGKKQGGTGLGLAIAKWIIDRHDGYFEVLSREEFGTRITIHLPKTLPLTPKETDVQ